MHQDYIRMDIGSDTKVNIKTASDWTLAVYDLYLISCARCKAQLSDNDLTELGSKWERSGWHFMEEFDGKPPHMLCKDCYEWIQDELKRR